MWGCKNKTYLRDTDVCATIILAVFQSSNGMQHPHSRSILDEVEFTL
jgi:hypothetical protein